MDADERMLDVRAVAAIVGVCPRTIRGWVAQGRFPSPALRGRITRWRRSTIAAWLDGQERLQPRAPPAKARSQNG